MLLRDRKLKGFVNQGTVFGLAAATVPLAIAQSMLGASWRRMCRTLAAVVWSVAALVAWDQAFAQTRCLPTSQRTSEIGCWVTADEALGQLPQRPIFWHLDTYLTRVAAEAAKGPRGTVVESLGRVWLFTITEAGWRPSSGARVAEIDPLPVSANTKYTARYMEAIFTPGMTAASHRHPGPEAWYTLSGESCLETPEGKMVGRAGANTSSYPAVRRCISRLPARTRAEHSCSSFMTHHNLRALPHLIGRRRDCVRTSSRVDKKVGWASHLTTCFSGRAWRAAEHER
jgi:quercetin dioxygenase-like cupin family protein